MADGLGTVHACYVDKSDGRAKYATSQGGVWKAETLFDPELMAGLNIRGPSSPPCLISIEGEVLSIRFGYAVKDGKGPGRDFVFMASRPLDSSSFVYQPAPAEPPTGEVKPSETQNQDSPPDGGPRPAQEKPSQKRPPALTDPPPGVDISPMTTGGVTTSSAGEVAPNNDPLTPSEDLSLGGGGGGCSCSLCRYQGGFSG